ncbi:butyrophilin-like protein 2 isoform X1 [Saccopteryx bilineata]|uniref:butyrophilin-like protein 2 isoform X1 n=1 Tax=Saccopteryx bilineata TaxID=59482 RepID=UPI00338F2C44
MVDFLGHSLSGVVASFFFILLTVKRPEEFRVVGPAGPILARVGEDALLSCRLLPQRPAARLEVRWYRSEPSTQVLFASRDGAEAPEEQAEGYRGRVQWVEDGVAQGRVALKMDNIRPADDGQYWCGVREGDYYGETSLLLSVAGLGSAPLIHMEGAVEGELQLVCTAEGWFPEPQVHWEDSRGDKLLNFSQYHVQAEDGLFYVESTLVLRNASTETVSCFVHNPVLAEEKASAISISEKLQTELASLKVIGPSQPLLVRVGEDIQLSCDLSPAASARSMEVRWVRSHRHPAVHVYVDGDHVPGGQMAEYRGRTVLVTDDIGAGRLTLRIRDARTSDDGPFWCLFEKDGVYQEKSLDLRVVGVGSSPQITWEELQGGDIQLMCTSEGWFPEPHVQWRDAEGKPVLSFPTVLPGGDGLFQVQASLLVTNGSVANVTCSISNTLLHEEKTATFSFSDSRMTFSWAALLMLGLVLLVAAGLTTWKSGRTVTVTRDPKTAHPEPILSEGAKHKTFGHSFNQTTHSSVETYSGSWASSQGARSRRGR